MNLTESQRLGKSTLKLINADLDKDLAKAMTAVIQILSMQSERILTLEKAVEDLANRQAPRA